MDESIFNDYADIIEDMITTIDTCIDYSERAGIPRMSRLLKNITLRECREMLLTCQKEFYHLGGTDNVAHERH